MKLGNIDEKYCMQFRYNSDGMVIFSNCIGFELGCCKANRISISKI